MPTFLASELLAGQAMVVAEEEEASEEGVDWLDMSAKAAELVPPSPVAAPALEHTDRGVGPVTQDARETLESGALMETQDPSPLRHSLFLRRSLKQDAVDTI